jgi:hypothetical protein
MGYKQLHSQEVGSSGHKVYWRLFVIRARLKSSTRNYRDLKWPMGSQKEAQRILVTNK